MSEFSREAERKAKKDFFEVKGGRYDQSNDEHRRFMQQQIAAHEDLLERKRREKELLRKKGRLA